MLDFINFWIKKLNPLRFFRAPVDTASGMFTENARSRGLLLGIPAVVLVLVFLLALAWTSFRREGQLEEHYNTMASIASKTKQRLASTIRDQMLEDSSQDQEQVKKKSKEQADELEDLGSQEELYLEKLIALNPDDADYRYRLSVLWLDKGNRSGDAPLMQKGMALMNTIAPADKPGYAKAHFYLSRFLLNRKVSTPREGVMSRRLALKHVEHCLVRDKNNKGAQLLRAKLYGSDERWDDAYKIYEGLFETDPQFYQHMITINRRRGNDEAVNKNILSNAQNRFLEMVDNIPVGNNQKWSFAWNNLTRCMIQMKQFEGIEKLLKAEEGLQTKLKFESPSFEVSARLAEVKRMLTLVYTDWASTYTNDSIASLQSQLELLKKALSYDNDNPNALRLISRIATGDTELAADARRVYDPEKDDDAPASVYNDLGSLALTEEKYNLAIKYFELAKRKRSNDPLILNNLAFTYLVCENKDPDLALDLVNKAIRAIVQIPDKREQAQLASHFFDTRGRALMQMDRMGEAAAAFEHAIQYRPGKREILEALVKCYEGRDDVQAEVYRRRIAEIESKQN